MPSQVVWPGTCRYHIAGEVASMAVKKFLELHYDEGGG